MKSVDCAAAGRFEEAPTTGEAYTLLRNEKQAGFGKFPGLPHLVFLTPAAMFFGYVFSFPFHDITAWGLPVRVGGGFAGLACRGLSGV
jgi:hypothetical protein